MEYDGFITEKLCKLEQLSTEELSQFEAETALALSFAFAKDYLTAVRAGTLSQVKKDFRINYIKIMREAIDAANAITDRYIFGEQKEQADELY